MSGIVSSRAEGDTASDHGFDAVCPPSWRRFSSRSASIYFTGSRWRAAVLLLPTMRWQLQAAVQAAPAGLQQRGHDDSVLTLVGGGTRRFSGPGQRVAVGSGRPGRSDRHLHPVSVAFVDEYPVGLRATQRRRKWSRNALGLESIGAAQRFRGVSPVGFTVPTWHRVQGSVGVRR